MYSLYRAWFGGEETYPRLESLSPPDTLVRVGNEGEHQFVAHRGVLAAHSGYLKALLSTSTGASSSGSGEGTPPITSVSVSSVGGEAFAPLLNYMYTGRLEVTLENIYSVLLATHLLHMPGALEQCRAALLRLRGAPPAPPLAPSQQTDRPGILRPVPNRLVGPPLSCWSQPNSLYPSPHVGLSSHISNFQLSGSGLPLLSAPPVLQDPNSLPYRENSASPVVELRRNENIESEEKRHVIPSREEVEQEVRERESAERLRNGGCDATIPDESNEKTSSTTTTSSATEKVSSRKLGNAESPTGSRNSQGASSSGVVYDVACCDGPVRFHRVLNENYVSTSSPRNGRRAGSEEELVEARRENDENGKPEETGPNPSPRSLDASSSGTNGSYTCGYCRHTFKSHYCYRKHARRHLLPSQLDPTPTINPPSPPSRNDARRREVKLLDLNVQCYPCKICGSKFPSYYFVHKHKRLCHANVEENSVEAVNVVSRNAESNQ